MPHPFHIRVTNEVTGAVDEQSGEFSDEEWRRLSEYLVHSHRLAASRMARSQADLNFKIGGAVGEPTRIQATLPPEDDIAAFLHFLRPFVLTNSATSFARMRNLLARRITLAPVQHHLKRLKELYAGKEIPFEIEIGSRAGKLVLNSEDAMNKWLNGLEYHQDDDKRDAVLSAFTVFTAPAARAMLLYCLLQRASAIGKLGALIDGLAKREGRAIRTA